MTLILSCITRDLVVQVSDRRLTWIGGPHPGEVADDMRNKAVVVCSELVLGYTGLGELGNRFTDEWIVDVASSVTPPRGPNILRKLCEDAENEFRRFSLSAAQKRHAFIAAGWGLFAEGGPLTPFVASISNAFNDKWGWQARADDAFRIRMVPLPADKLFGLVPAGAALSDEERQYAHDRLHHFISHNGGVLDYLGVLADVVRHVASRDPLVGRALLATVIPRSAAEKGGSALTIPLAGEVPSDSVSSFYLPSEHASHAVLYGPHFLCDGFASMDAMVASGDTLSEEGEFPLWFGHHLVLGRCVSGRRTGEVIPFYLQTEYSTTSWRVIESTDRDSGLSTRLCLIALRPSPSSLTISRDTRFFVLTGPLHDPTTTSAEDWIVSLLDWLRQKNVPEAHLTDLANNVRGHTHGDAAFFVRRMLRSLNG